MILLHAGFFEKSLLVWAESDALFRTGNDPKKGPAAPHPFAVPGRELRQVLKEALPAIPFPGRSRKARAWLPSAAGRPFPSAPLVGEAPDRRRKPALTAWTLSGLPLGPGAAAQFLGSCLGRPALARGLLLGQDLEAWSEAANLVRSVVRRQRFLPALIRDEDGSWRARWRPVFLGADSERHARLVRNLPGACRCFQDGKGKRPPQTPSATVLESFQGRLTDHLVRQAGLARRTVPRERRPTGSLHEAWLAALQGTNGLMKAPAGELEDLAREIADWTRPLDSADRAPFRLAFRLEEPQDDSTSAPRRRTPRSWTLRFLLQDASDPSLLLPVKEAWKKRGPALQWKRHGQDPRERVLAGLGQAACLEPCIGQGLKNAHPEACSLETAGAWQFLSRGSLALEQAGFRVLLPAWWTRRGTRARLAVRARVASPKMQASAGLDLASVLSFDWELALGGKKISLRELEDLARLKSPLVRVRGQWVQVDAGEIQAALDWWKKKGRRKEKAGLQELVRMALGGPAPTPAGLPVEGLAATGWIRKFLGGLEDPKTFQVLSPPKNFQGELRPYQERGFSWLAFLARHGLGACLADDMGLGKTIQTLALLQRAREQGRRRPVLLVCPLSVLHHWKLEAARFTPELPVVVHHGTKRRKGASFTRAAKASALVLTSYAILSRDRKMLEKQNWAGVVLDEAQNIKNPGTLQARAARAMGTGFRIALTGTPVENHVGELWSLMEFLNPGLLGSMAAFKKVFLVPIQAEGDREAAERLRRLTHPFILRRMKTDRSVVPDLPRKVESKVFCPLTKEQASLYMAVTRETEEAILESSGMERRGAILAALSKLKQICNHPAHFLDDNSSLTGRSGKLNRLEEILEELLEVGDRCLIFTQFTKMGALLQRHIQETFGREVLYLHGGVPKMRRDRMVERFQAEEGGPPIFLLSLKAGGTGLNLTGANHVIHFDRWWNPAVESQATDRAYRIGQRRKVQVHKFLCTGTLEERIDEMIERKRGVARMVVAGGDKWLTEFSNAELKNLFTLRRETLGD